MTTGPWADPNEAPTSWRKVGYPIPVRLGWRDRLRALFGIPIHFEFSLMIHSLPGTEVSAKMQAVQVARTR